MEITPKILALDASSSQCSVALTANGRTFVRRSTQARQAAQLLLPMIKELLVEAGLTLQQLDAIAVAAGPGSFTGLRIGIGVVQGLGLASNLPILPLSNLAILSFMSLKDVSQGAAMVSIQARDGEVYFGVYRRDFDLGVVLMGSEQVERVADLELESIQQQGIDRWFGVGDGFNSRDELLLRTQIKPVAISICNELSIEDVCALASLQLAAGRAVQAELVQPNYIKEQLDY